MTSRDNRAVRRHLWWVVGLVLVCTGLAVALSARVGPDDFGWFAYSPATAGSDWHMSWSDPMSSGSALIVSRWQLAGSLAAVLGLMIIAAGAGFRLGQRRGQPSEQQ